MIFILFFLLICFVGYFLFFTAKGSAIITKLAISYYAKTKTIDIEKSEGSLSQVARFEKLEFKDFALLPKGSTVKIQKLEVYFTSFGEEGLNVNIYNGRLQLPNSALIIFEGKLQNSNLNFNIYSQNIKLKEIAGLFSGAEDLKKISGAISDTDIYLLGSLIEPKFSGKFQLEQLLYNNFSLSNCPVGFNIQLKNIKKEAELYGKISLNKGVITGPRTALVNLEESRISFAGEPNKPLLDLRGTSYVEGIKINIVLKGAFDKPDLKLSSEPVLPEDRLLVMLMTDKSWKATELALGKAELSVELAKDFIDYFLFSGSGSKIARKLGIKDISVTFEEGRKGIGIKKEISEKLDATYAVEQRQSEEELPATTQKVGGEYKITDTLTVGAEKELPQEQKTPVEQKTEDKVTIEFKKEF